MSSNELSASLQRLQESSLVPTILDKPGYIRPASISEAVMRNPKTMLTLQKERGLQPLVGWVKGRLIELFTYLGAFDIVTEYQIQLMATRICTRYYYWTTAELDFAFLSFANGDYGKLVHYNHHNDSPSVVNPQDLMNALQKYEKDLLEERGKAEEKKMAEEAARKKAEEAKKPHGLAAWKQYCEENGLDPATHKLATVKLHDVNEELYPERGEHGIFKRTINKIKNKL